MLGEIQRLKAMGFGKKAVARTLGISRNTLKKYWKSPEEEPARENTGGFPAVYRAPWSDSVDWKVVGEAIGRGQALSHYWERFLEGRPLGDPLRQVPYVSFWREYAGSTRGDFPRFPWGSTGPILRAPAAKRTIKVDGRGWGIGIRRKEPLWSVSCLGPSWGSVSICRSM